MFLSHVVSKTDLCLLTSKLTFFLFFMKSSILQSESTELRYSFDLGRACFPEILQNFSEHQILLSLCLVVFHALTLRLPIQTSLSVVPKLQVCTFRKTSTPLGKQIICIISGPKIQLKE